VNHGLEEYLIKKYIRNEKSFEACLVYFLNGEYSNLVYENIDFILEHIEGIDLFWLKKTMNDNGGVTIKVKKKIEEQVRENVLIMIKNLYLLGEKYKNFSAEDMQKMDTILDVVYLIIEDVCKNEQISISDMEILSSGAFSDVLRLGDKIVKIGYNRGTKKFPNNPYVVSMLLRKEIPINKDVSLFIEVNERVDTDTEVSDEELYQLYQKVRELHLIWVDVAVRNVGRLLKDNQIYWREELPITDERLGLQPYRGQGVLKKGELVILDNDLIFDEKDDSTVVYQFQTALQKEFEERYQRRIKNRSRSDAIMKVQDDTEFYEVVGRKR
jgi:hypothetical protein